MGAWAAHLMKCPTLEFGSGHVVAVGGFDTPTSLCSEHGSCSDSVSLSLSLYLSCLITHSLSQNTEINIKKEKIKRTIIQMKTNKQTNSDTKPEESCLLVPGTGGCAGLGEGLSGPISVSLTPIEKQLPGTERQGLV